MMIRIRSTMAAAVLLVLPPMTARADEAAVAGRKVLARYQDSVLTVKLVLQQSMSFMGQERKQETRSETTATLIDPSGLCVISLSAIDPSTALSGLMNRAMRGAGAPGGQIKFESEVVDIKLLMADGTELPAEVVLRDKDLDLAYIRPTGKLPHSLPVVDLSGDVKPAPLDETIALNRLGTIAGRAASVSIERINAVVDKPRRFYVLGSGQGMSGVGSPVFTLDGRLIGVVLIRSVPPEGAASVGDMFGSATSLGIMPIIVPAADIREGAKQALEEKKPAAAAEAK